MGDVNISFLRSRYLSVLCFVIVALAYTGDAYSAWVTTTLDSEGTVGLHSSITIDSSDKVHISYYDETNGDLKYLTNASSSWITTTVDSDGSVGEYTSIAIDSSDKVHISYHLAKGDNLTYGDLKYANNITGVFLSTTLDAGGDVGEYTSIAIDSSDKVHISYQSNKSLKYATNATGAWVTTTVDSSGFTGRDTSIAIDSSGKAHISYYDETSRYLKYATNATGVLITKTLDFDGDVGEYTSIAIDSSGKAHISYYDETNDDLKYITNAPGFWGNLTIDSTGGLYTSMAIDTSGKAHISYYDETNDDLKYATNASGVFVTTTLDSGGGVGEYTSMVIGSSERIHISYYDGTDDNLKYASTVIPDPVSQQSYSYSPIVSPVLNIDPAKAKPLGIGGLAIGRDRLTVRVSLEQFEGGMDIYGAYTVSTDPELVFLLNPDGSTFTQFTVSEINSALTSRGTPPSGAEPWKSLILFPLNEVIVNVPVSSLPSGIYTAYLLVTRTDFVIVLGNQAQSLNDYYLWSTSFVIP